ncbi:MAG: hypothetical protein P4M11_13240 [Candidatus Pacebacteria bacterium]|nr:hypothetical protein [Candidatus Paceibacterota bacterium]
MSKCYKGFFEKVIERVVQECSRTRIVIGDKIKHILMTFSDSYSRILPFTVLAQAVTNRAAESPAFYSEFVEIMGDILTYEAGFYDVRAKLADSASEEGKALFNVLYPSMYLRCDKRG